ncbi:hypothetical protein, partial [Fibrobacter sp. UWH9]|uniref:hypothetical protein n=1 Tax=Fibrobacter sp. UWH9 TaxID=1896213 RepID=UPI001C31531C
MGTKIKINTENTRRKKVTFVKRTQIKLKQVFFIVCCCYIWRVILFGAILMNEKKENKAANSLPEVVWNDGNMK